METVISKEKFVSIIDRMDKLVIVEDLIEQILKKSGNDMLKDAKDGANLMLAENDLVIELLEFVMKDDCNYIDSFIYEQDFGRNENMNKFNENGREIEISNSDQLYDFLVERMENYDNA